MRNKVLFFILLSNFLFSTGIPGDGLVNESVSMFYNYNFDNAVSLLTEGRKNFPENPRIHFTWVASRMLASEAKNSIEVSYQVLEKDLNEIIPYLKSLSKKYNDIPEYKLYYGSAIGLKARISLGKKEWISTFVNAFKGFRIIYNIEKQYPDLADAKLPIGIVEYFASLNPKFIQWIARFWGINATRKSGLEKINEAAERGQFSSIEARKILAFLYLWVEDNLENSKKNSYYLSKRFPKNFFFNIMYIESLIKSKDFNNADKVFIHLDSLIHNLGPTQKKMYISYINYERAQYYFFKNDYDRALKFIYKSINQYSAELDIVLSHALLLRGKIYDIKNKRDKAINSYQKCVKLKNYSSAIKDAKLYIAQKYKNYK